MKLSEKTVEEVARFASQPPIHPSHWNNVWVSVAFDILVEPVTRAWYSIQPWPRDQHTMDNRRSPALTIIRNNISLHATSSGGDSTTEPTPVSDMQGVILIDYLNASSWGDPSALKELEERIQNQTAYALSIRPGEYGYARDTIYFIMAIGVRWRFGVRDAFGFRYLSNWCDLTMTDASETTFKMLVDMVEQV